MAISKAQKNQSSKSKDIIKKRDRTKPTKRLIKGTKVHVSGIADIEETKIIGKAIKQRGNESKTKEL